MNYCDESECWWLKKRKGTKFYCYVHNLNEQEEHIALSIHVYICKIYTYIFLVAFKRK